MRHKPYPILGSLFAKKKYNLTDQLKIAQVKNQFKLCWVFTPKGCHDDFVKLAVVIDWWLFTPKISMTIL